MARVHRTAARDAGGELRAVATRSASGGRQAADRLGASRAETDAAALLAAMDSDLEPEYGPARTVNAVTRRLADIGAAAGRLGWKPELDLQDGLRDLVAWWRAATATASA